MARRQGGLGRKRLTPEQRDYIEKGDSELTLKDERTLPLARLVLPNYQPRQYFDPCALEELAASVREVGVIEPLLVRPLSNNTYEVVAGGRRYRAAKMAQLNEVPVTIHEMDDDRALAVALVENLQREDLSVIEEVESVLKFVSLETGQDVRSITAELHRLRKDKDADKDALNVKSAVVAVFDRFGINWRSFASNKLSVLNLPEDVTEALRQGQLTYTKAKAIAKVEDEAARQQLINEAIVQNLSVKAIRARAASEQANGNREPQQQLRDSAMQTLRSRLHGASERIAKTKLDPQQQAEVATLLDHLEQLLQ